MLLTETSKVYAIPPQVSPSATLYSIGGQQRPGGFGRGGKVMVGVRRCGNGCGVAVGVMVAHGGAIGRVWSPMLLQHGKDDARADHQQQDQPGQKRPAG